MARYKLECCPRCGMDSGERKTFGGPEEKYLVICTTCGFHTAWLHDECSIPVKKSEHGANCPICGAFFNQDHAFRKPQYCEDCGCRLGWQE